jgi:hypothetical protein
LGDDPLAGTLCLTDHTVGDERNFATKEVAETSHQFASASNLRFARPILPVNSKHDRPCGRVRG